jgi:3,4-dihydroxy 2-butanone 4-phosphate synthase/GTP cyclohydrolase II
MITKIQLSSIEEILDDYRAGKMVIITDDEDRENEGDLMVCAEKVTPETINFMARFGRGLICMTLTEARCEQLGLELMVGENGARFSTNFTVSIEAARGVTTGISAADRATTILAAAAADATARDIVTPGHIFPIMAQPGGVLSRAGHTEAGIDLPRLAGLDQASVICEILNEDGSMARLPDLIEFAREHDLKICSIAELIRYRLKREPTVVRQYETQLETAMGEYKAVVYKDVVRNETHVALVKGEIDPEQVTPVRVHVDSDLVGVLQEMTSASAWTTSQSLSYINQQDQGVLIIVRYDRSEEEVLNALEFSRAGNSQNEESRDSGDENHLRLLGAGSQILSDLGARQIRVLGEAKRVHGLAGFGIEIVDHVSADGQQD